MREKILSYIETNSRVDLHDLAIIMDSDEATIMNELEATENEHIICGYHTIIDWDKAGSDMITALIEVRVTPQRDQGFDKIAERIYNFPEVTAVYLISGGYDLMVILEGWTLKGVSQFVSEKLAPIESIIGTSTYFILKKYKDHGTIMVPQKKEERMLVTP